MALFLSSIVLQESIGGGGEDEEKGEKHQNPRLHLGRILEEILVLCFNVAALQLTAHASLALELTWHSPPVVYS